MTKVLFFHHNSRISGAGVSGRNVIRSIDKEKYEVVVYCSTGGSTETSEFFQKENVRVINAGYSPQFYEHCVGSEHLFLSPRHLKNIFAITTDKKRVRQVIMTEKPDIVILNSMTLFWIGSIAKEFSCKVILFFRETWTHGLFGLRNRIIQKRISKTVDEVVFISEYDRKHSPMITCLKKTVYNAIDFDDTRKWERNQVQAECGMEPEKFQLLYVGGISKLKGIHILLEAMPSLGKKFHLNVVGYKWNGKEKKLSDCKGIVKKVRFILGIDYERRCIDIIQKYNLASKVTFYPPEKSIGRFYVACDAVVFPMTKPHQARPLFEAGASKIPCIISEFENIKEFASEENCYLFKPNDSDSLAHSIRTVMENSQDREKKVEKNYIDTLKRHNYEDYVIAIRKAMNQIVENEGEI